MINTFTMGIDLNIILCSILDIVYIGMYSNYRNSFKHFESIKCDQVT